MLLYAWHMETITSLQAKYQLEIAKPKAEAAPARQQELQLVDLLMQSYSMTDGSEAEDVRALMMQQGDLPLLKQLLEQSQVDVADLLDVQRSFNAAELHASLLRIKTALNRQYAKASLQQWRQQQPSANPQPSN